MDTDGEHRPVVQADTVSERLRRWVGRENEGNEANTDRCG
jgi:hypothetical protein